MATPSEIATLPAELKSTIELAGLDDKKDETLDEKGQSSGAASISVAAVEDYGVYPCPSPSPGAQD
jgi:hypothetical protein